MDTNGRKNSVSQCMAHADKKQKEEGGHFIQKGCEDIKSIQNVHGIFESTNDRHVIGAIKS